MDAVILLFPANRARPPMPNLPRAYGTQNVELLPLKVDRRLFEQLMRSIGLRLTPHQNLIDKPFPCPPSYTSP